MTRHARTIALVALACFAAGLSYHFLFSAPTAFPKNTLIQVGSGETGESIAEALQAGHIIRSNITFNILLRLLGHGTHLVAGQYYFPHPQNVISIVWRLENGNFGITPVKVVLPEGTDSARMAVILGNALPGFDKAQFLVLARPLEGYLFPDTYFLYPGESPKQIVQTMRSNFDEHVQSADVQRALQRSGKPLSDIVTMASLIEKEAPDTDDRRIISGILWKRISLDMPLQVDAVFPYITGNSTITHADLQIDSPYNTYIHLGLPPAPITNPGEDAVIAAAMPSSTSYLYYLSDAGGAIHYSATYAGQVANQQKYLR